LTVLAGDLTCLRVIASLMLALVIVMGASKSGDERETHR
jgi:hypothetical protein